MADGEVVELRDGGWIRYWSSFLAEPEADRLFAALRQHVPWEQVRNRLWTFPRLRHELPKTTEPIGERINLTFRKFIAPPAVGI